MIYGIIIILNIIFWKNYYKAIDLQDKMLFLWNTKIITAWLNHLDEITFFIFTSDPAACFDFVNIRLIFG